MLLITLVLCWHGRWKTIHTFRRQIYFLTYVVCGIVHFSILCQAKSFNNVGHNFTINSFIRFSCFNELTKKNIFFLHLEKLFTSGDTTEFIIPCRNIPTTFIHNLGILLKPRVNECNTVHKIVIRNKYNKKGFSSYFIKS